MLGGDRSSVDAMAHTADLTHDDEHAVTGPSSLAASMSVLAGALCLSVSAVLVKLADVDASTTAVLRCAIAAVVLIPMAWWEYRRRGPQPTKAVLWSVVAGIALGVDYAAWTASIYDVGAGISTVLINVQVIVLPALAWAFDRDRPSRRFMLAVPLMAIGIALVGGIGSTGSTGGSKVVTGTALGVLAGVGYGAYLYLSRRADKVGPGLIIQALCWATCSAAVTAAALSPLGSGLSLSNIDLRSWALLIALAVLGQVLAWLLINRGSTRLPPTATAALLLIQPILALALSALVLSEYPHWLQLVGAAMVLVAVAVSNNVAATIWGKLRV